MILTELKKKANEVKESITNIKIKAQESYDSLDQLSEDYIENVDNVGGGNKQALARSEYLEGLLSKNFNSVSTLRNIINDIKNHINTISASIASCIEQINLSACVNTGELILAKQFLDTAQANYSLANTKITSLLTLDTLLTTLGITSKSDIKILKELLKNNDLNINTDLLDQIQYIKNLINCLPSQSSNILEFYGENLA